MDKPFQVETLDRNSVADVLAMWPHINFEPIYQRESDLWGDSRKQLFIDSLINGYDVPKLYFHDLSSGSKLSTARYAIIDGKQRLKAIHDFVGGQFGLSDEFEDVTLGPEDAPSRAAKLTYAELGRRFPELKTRLDLARLPVMLVQTEDLDYIEEMFTRLNEALPLNAPEKRNALGGPLPRHIRSLARAEFFRARLAFKNGRYRYLDLATKFLYVEEKGGITDLKKRNLDDFVKLFRKGKRVKRAGDLHARCTLILEKMGKVFRKSDDLLDSVGMITVYYCLFRDAFDQRWLGKVTRDALQEFDNARKVNRENMQRVQELALENKKIPATLQTNTVLAAFERYVQSPNDLRALTQRYRILRQFIETGEVPASED